MKTEKIQPTSFGTKPLIGDISAHDGLRKYSKKLTAGVLDAFEKLSANDIDDMIRIDIGHKKGAKSFRTDSFEIIYFIKDKQGEFRPKSSLAFSPKVKQKFSISKISKLIQDKYSSLKESNQFCNDGVDNYPYRGKNMISKTHSDKIIELVKKYGFDDWTQE